MSEEDLRNILESLARGEISVDEALKKVRLFTLEVIDNVVRFDIGRKIRRDVPEIVYGEGKDAKTLISMVQKLAGNVDVLVISRLTQEQIEALRTIQREDIEIMINDVGRIAVVKRKGVEIPKYPCKVGILAAGTADVRVAEEAKTIVEVMGCRAVPIYDVGVAGLHRVLEAMKRLKEEDVDVIIAIAGMEGALPSVVASLSDVPVIGVPTSVGYGAGGGGIAALYSMLQACSLGLAVVNIDSGIGAGVIASLIGRRVAYARKRCDASNT